MPEHSSDPRLAAVRNILAVLGGRSLDDVLATARSEDDRDRALSAELSYGVCRWYRRLDALIGRLLQKPFKPRDRDLHVLLLVGAYQLLYSRVPAHAALSATVDVTRHLEKGWASRVVNGVLRRLQREHEQLESTVDADPATRVAQPDWLYRQVAKAWPDHHEQIFEALQQRPPMVLRVDLRQAGRADHATQLAAAGIMARPHPTVGSALLLDKPVAVDRLPGFAAARISVQDAGAQLAAEFLDLRDGQRVLDACAAPGGKTLAILQRADGLQLTALDIDQQRLVRVEENLARAGLSANLVAGDAARPGGEDWAAKPFDRILVDAPCSATGVMRRHPDIRLLRRSSDIDALVRRQAAILDAMWSLLAPGGRLLYVTCSLLPAENADQIDAFLARNDNVRVVELPTATGSRCGKGVQLLPGVDVTDGFFYAALEKAVAV
jgi:16S rRNA (cytosine967-C5)-methyltransferase